MNAQSKAQKEPEFLQLQPNFVEASRHVETATEGDTTELIKRLAGQRLTGRCASGTLDSRASLWLNAI